MTVDTSNSSNTPGAAAAAAASSSSPHQTTHVQVTRKSRSEVIKTIQEITPLDEATINRAIEACQDSEGRYSIDQVLNVLMDDVRHVSFLILSCKCLLNIKHYFIIYYRDIHLIIKTKVIFRRRQRLCGLSSITKNNNFCVFLNY